MKFGLDKNVGVYGLKIDDAAYAIHLGGIESMILDDKRELMLVAMASGDKHPFPARFFEHMYESWIWYLDGSPEDSEPVDGEKAFYD